MNLKKQQEARTSGLEGKLRHTHVLSVKSVTFPISVVGLKWWQQKLVGVGVGVSLFLDFDCLSRQVLHVKIVHCKLQKIMIQTDCRH